MNRTRAVAVSIQPVEPESIPSAQDTAGTQDNRMPHDVRRKVLLSMDIPLKDLNVNVFFSEGVEALLTGADTHHLLQPGDEDLAIANLARVGRTGDGVDSVVHLLILDP